ncbi:MAG: hypothetical protein L7S46_01215, partial [Candidatus Poseidoniaceae archaeon]|nr:hypothetical protein [Candidatus Poseidoniaceae archaeon]
MSSSRDRLQQLLDGDLSPEDIADDPALVSLADRLYGIKIAPARPKKARDMVDNPVAGVTEVAPPTDMLIEVIGDIGTAAPLPDLPAGGLPAIAPIPGAKGKMNPLVYALGAGLAFVVANLFGLFQSVLGGNCQASDLCPADGYTRMNLLDLHNLDTGMGWSLPLQEGAYGIPDVVAVLVLTIGI